MNLKLSLFIILIPTPDFPHFYYMLGANLGSLLLQRCFRDNLLYYLGRTDPEVWMVSGTSKQPKCYPVHIIASKLDNDILVNILGFHALTASDTTSSFPRRFDGTSTIFFELKNDVTTLKQKLSLTSHAP